MLNWYTNPAQMKTGEDIYTLEIPILFSLSYYGTFSVLLCFCHSLWTSCSQEEWTCKINYIWTSRSDYLYFNRFETQQLNSWYQGIQRSLGTSYATGPDSIREATQRALQSSRMLAKGSNSTSVKQKQLALNLLCYLLFSPHLFSGWKTDFSRALKGQDFMVFTFMSQSWCCREKMLTCKGSIRLDPLPPVKKCCQQTD